MKNNNSTIELSNLKGYCHKHVPADFRKERHTDTAIVEAMEYYRRTMKGRRWADSQASALAMSGPAHVGYAEEEVEEDNAANAAINKRKRLALQRKIWRLPSGAPIIPQSVYDKVESALARFSIRKRKDFVAEACKYWSLKREARRGASLLKRLQLQMETFSAMELTRRDFVSMGAAGRPKLLERIEFAENLEKELSNVQQMCDFIYQRELMKLDDVDILEKIVNDVYTPMMPLMLDAIEKAIQ